MGAYGETYDNDLPGAIVDGFALEHVHRIPSTSSPPPPRAKIRTQSRDTATDAPELFRTPRDRIATFLKMNAIAYPASNATEPPQWWLNAAYSELLGSNASHFPGRPKGLEAEIAWRARQFRRFMTTVGLQWPETTVPSTTGQEPSLAVLVFRNPRTRATVLVFRGTMSRADVDVRTHATVAAAQPKLKKESTFVRTWLRVPAAWPVIAITAGAVVFSSYKIYHDLSGPDYHFNRYERSTLDYVENSRDPSTAIAHGQSAFHRGPSFIRERLIKME